jgi:predicted small integral membrane protein
VCHSTLCLFLPASGMLNESTSREDKLAVLISFYGSRHIAIAFKAILAENLLTEKIPPESLTLPLRN